MIADRTDRTPFAAPQPDGQAAPVARLLERGNFERAREHRYRMAQAIVFGVWVIALEQIGDKLGGRSAGLWSGAYQAILGGWVLYVGAAGMAFEGFVLLLARPRKLSADLPVAIVAASLWIWGFLSLCGGFIAARAGNYSPRPAGPGFALCVSLLIIWTAVRWRYFEKRALADAAHQ